ncbi:MAG: alpha-N-arabinofuranosidase, partial [Lachnospiraceae bacterium]|nr:alpha-N-arabinofuranosidase [Lachnospiraceae bacterium]
TNPGFLYQQNTVRDALVAGITLNIFNKHCDRVKMACLAQMVNVLQSVILTDGEKMLKTPTYHVFHQYRYHQGASLLESSLSGVESIGPDEWKVPELTESVSEKDGVITATIANLSVNDTKTLDIVFSGKDSVSVEEATIVTEEIHAYNTFEENDKVKEVSFSDYQINGDTVVAKIPAGSVVMIRVK